MGFKCGIIGLPNVGKSTLFNALTKASIGAENFPFCTIEPNIGVVPVPDPRLDQLVKIVKPQRVVPTTMEFVDIAGLIKGASKGEGLGNRFLAKIRDTEAICHVVRCFENDNITHVAKKVDPKNDIDIINTELSLSDLELCERAIYRTQKRFKYGDKKIKAELSVLEKCLSHLSNTGALRTLKLVDSEKKSIRHLNFLTLKAMMYVANVNEEGFKENSYLDKVYNIAASEGSTVIAVSAAIESDIAKLEEKEKHEFMSELGLKFTSLNRVIHAGYDLLNLKTYFTSGVKEIRAWTIVAGTTAAEAAGKIHTDLKSGFIRAQTISFSDFISYKGEEGAKESGKIRSEGKEYIVQDGDIINFLFNI